MTQSFTHSNTQQSALVLFINTDQHPSPSGVDLYVKSTFHITTVSSIRSSRKELLKTVEVGETTRLICKPLAPSPKLSLPPPRSTSLHSTVDDLPISQGKKQGTLMRIIYRLFSETLILQLSGLDLRGSESYHLLVYALTL